jgi:hypothetical protein
MQRYLTEKEIDSILDFIKPNKSLPPDSALSIVKNNKSRLVNQLKKQKIYPELIPELKKHLEKNYYSTLIQPGESVGIIAAMAIGEKQTQNSIVYDEQILVRKNGKIFKTTIGEFIDREMYTGEVIKIHDNSFVKPVSDIEILTISQTEKIEWKHVTELSKHPTNGDLVKIVTESGKSVTSTLSHSHLQKKYSEDGKSFEILPILGSELTINHRIPVIKRSPISEHTVKTILISDYIEYDKIKNGYVYVGEEKLVNEIVIDEIFAWFLAILISTDCKFKDEYILLKNVSANTEFDYNMKTIIERFGLKEIIGSGESSKPSSFYFKKKLTWIDMYFEHNIVSPILKTFIKSLFEDRVVPDFVYSLDFEIIKVLVKSWFEVTRFSSYVNIETVNEIRFLLTYLGINSRVVKITNGHYYVRIQKKYIPLFENIFGRINGLNIFENDYDETDETEVVDVTWERIVNIELVKEKDYKYDSVYDFSVKGNETFALFSGIVVHNTLNTFHKAEKLGLVI